MPFEFDTTVTWRRIIRIVFVVAGFLLLGILSAVATRKFGAAIGFAIAAAILSWIVRRVGSLPMGAAGTLTAAAVETSPVRVGWYSLPVPVGRFSINRFESIALVERVMMSRPGNSTANTGSVQLVGKSGTPTIEVGFLSIGEAMALAEELGALLLLPVRRRDDLGSTTERIMLR